MFCQLHRINIIHDGINSEEEAGVILASMGLVHTSPHRGRCCATGCQRAFAITMIINIIIINISSSSSGTSILSSL